MSWFGFVDLLCLLDFLQYYPSFLFKLENEEKIQMKDITWTMKQYCHKTWKSQATKRLSIQWEKPLLPNHNVSKAITIQPNILCYASGGRVDLNHPQF